jgi:hypothetical protein
MKTDDIILHLENNRRVFQSLLADLEGEEYHFKPDPASWSILEILCHLVDEEKEDFRARVKNTLLTPEIQPPVLDPLGAVKARKYSKQVFAERLEAFLTERRISIKWLRSLQDPKWKNVYRHPTAGSLTAYDLLTNWLAHDYHHIRQINRRKYEYLRKKSKVNLAYAGDW